jgi:hypothetical protein
MRTELKLAEWFGLEIARIVVDECLPERESQTADGAVS